MPVGAFREQKCKLQINTMMILRGIYFGKSISKIKATAENRILSKLYKISLGCKVKIWPRGNDYKYQRIQFKLRGP